MDVKKLDDYDLYMLIKDGHLPEEIYAEVLSKFDNRKLSIEQLDRLALQYEAQRLERIKPELSIRSKLLLIAFPFIAHLFISAPKVGYVNARRFHESYWMYSVFGYLFWTLLFILIAKWSLF